MPREYDGTRKRIQTSEDKLVLKVVSALARSMEVSRASLVSALEMGGLVDIAKDAAKIPFEDAVKAGVAGTAEAHLAQVRRTEETLRYYLPADSFVTEHKPLRLGVETERAKPTFTREEVIVDVGGMPGASSTPYRKALLGFVKACKSGEISSNDVRAILGTQSVLDKEIVDFLKQLDTWSAEWDEKLKEVAKSQDEFALNFNETLKRHAKTLGYSK